MRVVGLIPARAGSKRLPNKNLIELAGRPLLAHTCEAVLRSGVLAAVYINTDSPEIAAAAQQCGVACPILRPAALAQDDTPTRASNQFLLRALLERGENFDAVMVLQPTSPLRTAEDIRAAWRLFETNRPCAVVSVSPVAPATWLGVFNEENEFQPLPGEKTVHRLNGAIYVYAQDDYMKDRTPARTLAYVMPPARSVDIDTVEDLHYARFCLANGGVADGVAG